MMANHLEEMGNGGEMMHVPPDEDISEHLPSVTGSQSSPQEHSTNRNTHNRDGESGGRGFLGAGVDFRLVLRMSGLVGGYSESAAREYVAG